MLEFVHNKAVFHPWIYLFRPEIILVGRCWWQGFKLNVEKLPHDSQEH